MADDDVYSDDEVALILRRAAELQPGRALSLAEIEAAAAEAGIETALVRRAATELRTQPEARAPAPATGAFGPVSLVFERSVPRVIGPSEHASLLAEIRRHLTSAGKVEQYGDELIWSGKQRGIRVIVTPRKRHTLIRVEERAGGLAGGLYGGLGGGLALAGLGWILPIAIAVLGAPILIPVFIAVWTLGAYLLARTVHRGVLADRRAQLEALADDLAALE